MSKSKRTTFVLSMVAVVLTCCIAVVGTLAYLHDETGTITNTFTVGNVQIKLEEAKLADNKVDLGEGVVSEGGNQEYKIYPGQVVNTKDGIVTVLKDSEVCWVFVKVEINAGEVIDSVAINQDWSTVVETGTNYKVYAYKQKVGTAGQVLAQDTALTRVIDTVTIKNTVSNETSFEGVNIKLTAYAVQADNLATAQAAWTASGYAAN